MDPSWYFEGLGAVMSAVFLGSTFAVQGKRPSPRPLKKGILLSAFGTTLPEGGAAFKGMQHRVENTFPGTDIRWAYSSRFVRTKLARAGQTVDSPEMMLARMMDEGFTHVAVLSLHVIPGAEYHDLVRNAGLFARMTWGIERIEVARPLLSSHEDMVRVAGAMLKTVPPKREPHEGVVFVGHGNERHPADAIYCAMNGMVQELDPLAFVGTISGHPDLEKVVFRMKAKGVEKAYLVPLMTVAGDHARKDMAGDIPGSWKSVLAKNGIRCEPVLVGMVEHGEIVEIWLDHLRDAIERL